MYAYQEVDPNPLEPTPVPQTLGQAMESFANAMMTTQDFQSMFLASTVYCPRGDQPGFLALHDTQPPMIPIFSSLAELRKYSGDKSRHFSGTGMEVLDLLPNGYGLILDIEGAHRVMFDPQAIDDMVNFGMTMMYGQGGGGY